MIAWREKFLATTVHFGVTLILTGLAAAIIFLVWFPDPMQTLIGGTELFIIVVSVDLALGPLMSLVIYNSRKSRRELIIDYSVVGLVQIVALVYGVMVVAGARPVYYAFDTDRYEITSAVDIRPAELAAAEPQYRKMPWTGPRIVGVTVPPADQQNALSEALVGNETHQRPKYFVPLSAKLDQIRSKSKPIAELSAKMPPVSKPLLEEALADIKAPADRLAWLPAHHRKGFATVIIDTTDGKPLAWVDFDPY